MILSFTFFKNTAKLQFSNNNNNRRKQNIIINQDQVNLKSFVQLFLTMIFLL